MACKIKKKKNKWFGRKLCFRVLCLTSATVVIDINHHSGNSHFCKYLHIFLLNERKTKVGKKLILTLEVS